MKGILGFVITAVLVAGAAVAGAGDYNYVQQEQLKQWLESAKPMAIVDIQVPEEFQKHHFKGAIETNAFPVKTDLERRRLDQALTRLAAVPDPIVIVCPRGGGGARNAYDHLKAQGIAEKRLLILEKGMEGWPHPELTSTGR